MKKLFKKEDGFTIIEVMIVLAIGALILVVVLVAIPQLQRNQRNQARQSIAARIVTEINNYAGNNNGRYPQPDDWDGFVNRYLGGEEDEGVMVASDAFIDPLTEENIASDTVFTAVDGIPELDPGDAVYRVGRICDGESSVSAEARNFSYQVGLEGGAVYCLDNR